MLLDAFLTWVTAQCNEVSNAIKKICGPDSNELNPIGREKKTLTLVQHYVYDDIFGNNLLNTCFKTFFYPIIQNILQDTK